MTEQFEISISMAGVGVNLHLPSKKLYEELRNRYLNFLVQSHDHSNVIVVMDENWTGKFQSDYQQGFLGSSYTVIGGAVRGKYELDTDTGELILANNYLLQDVEYFLRAIFSILSFQSGGFMLHAAAVVMRDLSFLFFGHSGSGKSTVANLSDGYTILNDDLIILRKVGQKWMTYSTPFWNPGTIRDINSYAPLNVLCRLVQDTDVKIVPMDKGIALAELISNIPVVTLNQIHTHDLLNRCDDIIDKHNVYWLHFKKDRSFWKLISETQ